MIKTILVGLGDLAYSKSATDFALDLARGHGGRLTAVTLVDLRRLESTGPIPIGGAQAAIELREHRLKLTQEIVEQSIEHFETACREAGIEHQVLREEGDPFDRVVYCARYHDLMVCGLKNLFEHGVIDEPPNELVRLVEQGVRPLLAVTSEHRPVRRVLIAYSGTPVSAKAMRRLLQLRLWSDVTLRIVTFDNAAEEADRLLEDAANYCRAHGFEPEVEQVSGLARERLLPHAENWDADVIVLGNSARNVLSRKLFGETALHVVANTDRPLFLCQ